MAYYLSIPVYLCLAFRPFTYYTLVKLKNKKLPSLILYNCLNEFEQEFMVAIT